ncbi:MerR family transcriptional regulator [Paenibacillus sp. 1P07SE]|uniref:MerR family transcriptional regulator n=1 Tax=Paenibacillus sp. 1P07SE TaxID=3132209 RepID=UPI0039A44BE4
MVPIHELAKQTGITVRTLRYYDQIGLVKPRGKTEGGHRLYGEEEIKQLQQVQFLKSIGFRLQEIGTILSDPKWDWSSRLRKQMTYIREEQQKLAAMEAALRGVMHSETIEGEVSLSSIEQLIQLSGQSAEQKQRYRSQLFDDQELALWERLPSVSRDDPDSLEWIALIGQLKRLLADGAEPAGASVQRIIRSMNDKTQETFGDAPEFLDKLWSARTSPEASRRLQLYPLDPPLLAFIEAAYAVFAQETSQKGDEQ